MIDTLDTSGKWLEARVLDVDATGQLLYITYIGWNDRRN